MKGFLARLDRFLGRSLGPGPRGFLVLAALLLALTYAGPLWKISMFSMQYPDGLSLDIYSYRLEGENRGQDLTEINLLNHYVGMREIAPEDFTQFKWIPFVTGILGLLFLRAAVRGRLSDLADVMILYGYFGVFALGSFTATLWKYGHELSPTAPVKVGPFMPPVLGSKRMANFEVYSYPQLGTYAYLAVAACLFLALYLAWRSRREAEA